jgi:hypothetical protein
MSRCGSFLVIEILAGIGSLVLEDLDDEVGFEV